MPSNNKFFIDIHCHLFNAEHVPIRLSVRRITHNFNKGLVKRSLIAAGAGLIGNIALPILGLGSNAIAKKFYKKFEAFIQFFDQPAQDNIRDMVRSINKLGSTADINNRTRIFTPLIMDFEISEPYTPCQSGP